MPVDPAMVLGGFKIAIDALRGLSETASRSKIDEATTRATASLIDAQQLVLELQSNAIAQQKDNADLVKQLEEMEDWRTISSCYLLKSLWTNSPMFVYKYDPEKGKAVGLDLPHHAVCPACFEKKKRSTLTQRYFDDVVLRCQTCGFEIQHAPNPPSNLNMYRADDQI